MAASRTVGVAAHAFDVTDPSALNRMLPAESGPNGGQASSTRLSNNDCATASASAVVRVTPRRRRSARLSGEEETTRLCAAKVAPEFAVDWSSRLRGVRKKAVDGVCLLTRRFGGWRHTGCSQRGGAEG